MKYQIPQCNSVESSFHFQCDESTIVHPIMTIRSSFYPQVDLNLYAFQSSAEHQRRYYEKCVHSFWSLLISIVFFQTMKVSGDQQPFSSTEERNSLTFYSIFSHYLISLTNVRTNSFNTQLTKTLLIYSAVLQNQTL